MRSTARRALLLIFTFSMPLLVLGCPKKPVPVVDAGEPAAPAPTPSVTDLAPLTEDAGEDAGEDAAKKKKWVGPAVNPNQLKIKQCCNELRATHDPLLGSFAAQCDMLAAQVGPGGSDPAFAQLRAILKTQKLPAACSGL